MGGLKMILILDDLDDESNTQISNPFLTKTEFTESLDIGLELTEAKAIINQMANALLDAKTLRGLTAALNDPLLLHGDKEAIRARYLNIEAKIEAAFATSRRFLK